MTKALPFTEQAIRRAVQGARRAGLHVKGFTVSPDGAIHVSAVEKDDAGVSLAPDARQDDEALQWSSR